MTSAPSPPSERLFNAAILLLYAVVIAIGLWHHEPWRDELDSWLLARDSASVSELMRNMRSEGHPALWHLVLMPLTRVFPDPAAMQCLNWAIMTATAAVVLFAAPFPRLIRALLCFSYFFVFEYGVTARSYSLGLLLLIASVWCWSRGSYWWMAVLLALAANTSIFALFIVGALLLACLLQRSWRAERSNAGALVGAGVIIACGIILSMVQLLQAAEHARRSPEGRVQLRKEAATAVWKGYAPIPDPATIPQWNSNIIARVAGARPELLGGALSLALVASFTIALRKQRAVVVAYLSGTSVYLAFAGSVQAGFSRHYGHLFLLAVLCCWIHSIRHRLMPRLLTSLLTAVLIVQAAIGAWFIGKDIREPFSHIRAAADWLEQNGFADYPLATNKASRGGPLSAYLPARVYFLQLQQFGTFQADPRAGGWMTEPETIEGVRRWAGSRQVVLISPSALETASSSSGLKLLTSFTENMAEEKLFIYLVSPAAMP